MKQRFCLSLFVLALLVGIVLTVTLVVIPNNDNPTIPDVADNPTKFVGPNEEERLTLEEAGLKKLVFWMDMLNM